jgi:hypothetical protein
MQPASPSNHEARTTASPAARRRGGLASFSRELPRVTVQGSVVGPCGASTLSSWAILAKACIKRTESGWVRVLDATLGCRSRSAPLATRDHGLPMCPQGLRFQSIRVFNAQAFSPHEGRRSSLNGSRETRTGRSGVKRLQDRRHPNTNKLRRPLNDRRPGSQKKKSGGGGGI